MQAPRPIARRLQFRRRVRLASATVILKDGDDSLAPLPRQFAAATVRSGSGADAIAGSRFGDRLIGGPGPDRLSGGGGGDVFEEGAGADAGDVLRGGRGRDTVKYVGRSAAISADADGVADDGYAGEQDNIAVDVEGIAGGAGPDVLHGSVRTSALFGNGGNDELHGGPAAELIEGHAGDDRLTGGAGEDLLFGGPGMDVLDGGPDRDAASGSAGNDVVFARDGSSDFAGCDEGTERAELDALDMAFSDCEAVSRVGIAAGGPLVWQGFGGRLQGRKLETAVGCPVDVAGARCSGEVVLESAGRPVGRKPYSLPRGDWTNLPVVVGRGLRRRIRRRAHRVAVDVAVSTVLADGSTIVRRGRVLAF